MLTPPAVDLLNRLAVVAVGFDGLAQMTPEILLGRLTIAVVIGTIAAALAGWWVSRAPPLEHL